MVRMVFYAAGFISARKYTKLDGASSKKLIGNMSLAWKDNVTTRERDIFQKVKIITNFIYFIQL